MHSPLLRCRAVALSTFGFLGVLLTAGVPPLAAQGTGSGGATPSVVEAAHRLEVPAGTPMLRRGEDRLHTWGERSHFTLLTPHLRLIYNSDLGPSPNEGSLWAGRGLSSRLTAGARFQSGPLRLTLAPEVLWSQNQAFRITPPYEFDPGPVNASGAFRHPLARPWYQPPHSVDLPMRLGTDPLFSVGLGESSAALAQWGVRVGVGTQSRWWGPGLVNALALGGGAPGFPHVFLESDTPLPTPLGPLEVAWISGVLTNSPYLLQDESRSRRRLGGFAFALEPLPELRVGGTRLVLRSGVEGASGVARAALDPLTAWYSIPDPQEGGTPETDQLFSLFFHFAPGPGVEVYGEWARMDVPAGLMELFESPQHSQGYTLGFQWWRETASRGRRVRVQGEATNLEQTAVRPDRPDPPPFYTGRATLGGFTHQGRVLGASIGPGSQSQHLAVDLLPEESEGGWRAGALVQRVRWDTDGFYNIPDPHYFRHDISMRFGLRGGGEAMGFRIGGELSFENRTNYLFARREVEEGRDVGNWTLGLTVTPVGGGRP